MNSRLNLEKTLRLICSTCFILALVACGNNDDTVANAEILSTGDSTAKAIAKMPGFIQILALPDDGQLLAWVTIDDGTRTQMQTDISTGTSSASISGLSKSIHSVLIEFELSDGTDTVLLATATGDVDLTSGNGNLSFADSDYTSTGIGFDDDDDGFSNLTEIIVGTDPIDAGDKPDNPCILDTSVIGDCTLG